MNRLQVITKATRQVLGLCLLIASPALAQNSRFCFTDEHFAEQAAKNPALLTERAQMDAQIASYLASAPNGRSGNAVTRIIPTVVHVVHQYGSENISRDFVVRSINRLNTDMARRNADTATARAQFTAVGASLNLEFRLATIDPNGNCTDGVTRTVSPYTNGGPSRDSVKYAAPAWPTNKYFNIWVVRSIPNPGDPTQQILGFAQFPLSGLAITYGVVLLANEMDGSSRTLTHEVGHCFNLYHTFQGGCGTNCASSGDLVCDTPPSSAPTFGCNRNQNTCTNDSPNQVDMIENYMSYDNCTNMFTQGQLARANAAILQSTNLIQPLFVQSNLTAAGVADNAPPTAVCAPVADFSIDKYLVCAGTPVRLNQAVSNGTPDTSWRYTYRTPGARLALYTVPSPSIVYDLPGRYSITFIVRNPSGADSITKGEILVRPATSLSRGPYFQGFENDRWPADSVNDFQNYSIVSSSGFRWERTIVGAFNGTASVRIKNNGISTQTRSLVSPSFDLTSVRSPKLYFRRAHARRTRSATTDKFVIMTSTNCGQTWTQRLVRDNATTTPTLYTNAAILSGSYIPIAADWVLDSLTFPAPLLTSRNLLIRFDMISDNSNFLYLDDIRLASTATVTDTRVDLSPKGLYLSVQPNPADGNSTIQTNLPTGSGILHMLDATGRLIASKPLSSGNKLTVKELSTNLKAGIYILSLTSPEGVVRQRIVVQ